MPRAEQGQTHLTVGVQVGVEANAAAARGVQVDHRGLLGVARGEIDVKHETAAAVRRPVRTRYHRPAPVEPVGVVPEEDGRPSLARELVLVKSRGLTRELLLLRLGGHAPRVVVLAVLGKLREKVSDWGAAVNLAESTEGFHASLVRRLPVVVIRLRAERGEERVEGSLRIRRSGAGTENVGHLNRSY